MMLTGLKHVVKTLPPFRNLLSEREELKQRIRGLRTDLAASEDEREKLKQLLSARRKGALSAPHGAIAFLPEDAPDNGDICQRLLDAYQKATCGGGPAADGLWETFAAWFHPELEGYLRQKDLVNVARVLAQMFRHPVTSGLALGEETYLAAQREPDSIAMDWHHKAIALGLACGVLGAQTPEQGEYGTLVNLDSVAVVCAVAKRLGIDPAPPQTGAMFGVPVSGKIIPVNHLLHIYTAHRISTILDRQNWDCLEIGGGVGFLACMAARFGSRRFWIVDLPLVNVLQGYLLLKSSAADSVRLFGEDGASGDREIRIMPNWSIDQFEPKSFDLVINQDSLPEMGERTMCNYLEAVPRLSREYFLSINQEARAAVGPNARHGWVHDACRSIRRLNLFYRAPYWIREGYVEELFRVIDT